jgi:hypothetical protein
MNLKSRKLLCAAICFVCASSALLYGIAEFKDWADFVKWIFGLYAAGNVGEHATKKAKSVPIRADGSLYE